MMNDMRRRCVKGLCVVSALLLWKKHPIFLQNAGLTLFTLHILQIYVALPVRRGSVGGRDFSRGRLQHGRG